MPKYVEMPPIYHPAENMVEPPYPAELLSDTIERAIEQGVSMDVTSPPIFDPEDSDIVDLDCDIRTDLFAVAEFAEQQRSAAKAMSEAAAAAVVPVSDPTPSPTPVPDPVPVDPAK